VRTGLGFDDFDGFPEDEASQYEPHVARQQHKKELARLRSNSYHYQDEPIGVIAFLLLLSGFL